MHLHLWSLQWTIIWYVSCRQTKVGGRHYYSECVRTLWAFYLCYIRLFHEYASACGSLKIAPCDIHWVYIYPIPHPTAAASSTDLLILSKNCTLYSSFFFSLPGEFSYLWQNTLHFLHNGKCCCLSGLISRVWKESKASTVQHDTLSSATACSKSVTWLIVVFWSRNWFPKIHSFLSQTSISCLPFQEFYLQSTSRTLPLLVTV